MKKFIVYFFLAAESSLKAVYSIFISGLLISKNGKSFSHSFGADFALNLFTDYGFLLHGVNYWHMGCQEAEDIWFP